MGLTSALYAGLSGLNANQFRINTIGDNISNANTTGFKGSRSMFETQFSQILTSGSPPSGNAGGSDGIDVGLGAVVGSTQRDMTQGSTQTTGLTSDLAIDGQGFFVVRTTDNKQAYTRDGSFMLNAENDLVNAQGNYVQGFGVDQNYNVVPGILSDIHIPLGSLTAAKATTAATLVGNLSSVGSVGTQGTSYLGNTLVSDAAGTVAIGTTALTSLRDAATPAVNLFANGDEIDLTGITKGSRPVADAKFIVGTTGTTVNDFTNWMQSTLGINTTAGVPGNPGVTIDATGAINITGNIGDDNALNIQAGNIVDKTAGTQPLVFAKATNPVTGAAIDANGNSVYTTFQAFDSLGSPVNVNVTMALESVGGPSGGAVWRYFAESPDSVGGNTCVGTGTITIGDQGKAAPGSSATVTINRTGTGAQTPMVIGLDLSSLQGLASAGSGSSAQASTLAVSLQNGFGPGQLNSYSVGTDGTITGTFSNGLSQTLGQVALGTFSNPAGLVRGTNNLFSEGPNSGKVAITTPQSLGAGRVLSGALELSNVDMSREFIELINASSGFSASSRVISTSNTLLNDLLTLMRG
jgi:flagellar hook protein FlgE